uniref:Cysteine proteinase CG12163 n=1 Tax=Lygus hesperus TaxID=30085 RepID=A0A0K8SJ82_LYGHE
MRAPCFISGALLLAALVSAEEFMGNVELHEAHPFLQRRSVVGDLKEVDVSENDLVKELSQFACKTLDDLDEDNVRRTVVDILDAKKQLVNGIMYHLELKIQDTSCLEDEDITYDDSCMSRTTGNPKICKIRMHRSFADKSPHNAKVVSSECKDEFEVVGAITEAKSNSDYIHAMASFAMADLNGMSNSIYWYKLAEILEAKTQIANGMNTYLTVELHSTNCLKNDKYKSDKVCGVDPETLSKMVCHLVVWEQPWKNKKQVKKSSCSTLESPKLARNTSIKSKRSILGAESPAYVNDRKIEEMKQFLSHQLTARTNSDFIKQVVAVLNSSTQVVSGKLTRATVRVADTNCLKSENRNPSECNLSSQGHQICSVTILEQPWVHKKELTQSECHAVPSMAEVLGVSTEDKDLLSFGEFINRERRLYKTDEEMAYRFRVFRANMLKAAYLNKTEQGTATYGATMFADMTKSEFKQYTGLVYNQKNQLARLPKMAEIRDIEIPSEFDWREAGVVTPVKNQGQCGSCWAFSVTGNIEGLYAIANKELLSFSEQELVDCDKLDNGCNGGFFNTAFESIEDIGGLELEKDYPYHGRNEKCHLDKSEIKVSIKDYVNISSDELEMAKFLVQSGPISIALNANAMQFYMGGVSHPLRFLCDPDNLDHGVLIVGYGVHHYPVFNKTLPFWLIKNSWGEQWGVQGYYMAYRGDGTCGLNKAATSAILE